MYTVWTWSHSAGGYMTDSTWGTVREALAQRDAIDAHNVRWATAHGYPTPPMSSVYPRGKAPKGAL